MFQNGSLSLVWLEDFFVCWSFVGFSFKPRWWQWKHQSQGFKTRVQKWMSTIHLFINVTVSCSWVTVLKFFVISWSHIAACTRINDQVRSDYRKYPDYTSICTLFGGKKKSEQWIYVPVRVSAFKLVITTYRTDKNTANVLTRLCSWTHRNASVHG